MVLLCGAVPIFALGVLLVLLLRVTARRRLAREEGLAADLLEDLRALTSKGDLARLRTVLGSQDCGFADGLVAILDAEPGSSWASPESVAIGWRASEGRRSNSAHTLLAVLTACLISLALLLSAFWIPYLASSRIDTTEFAAGAFGTLFLWLSTAFAIRSTWLLDRERGAYATRLATWLLEAAALLARTPTPPPDPPAVVS